MGTTLTGTTPQDTYDSLIKVTDNGPLSGTLKKLTDGLGNDSSLSLSTTAASLSGTLAVASDVKLGTATTGTPSANADDLVIDKGAAESGITIMSTAAATLRFGDAANTSIGSIEYDHSGDYMRFNTSGSEKVRITSSGNVGIGTSAPQSKLQVVGGALFTGGVHTDASLVAGMKIGFDATNQYGFLESVQVDSSTKPLRINQYGGFVGVGNITPAVALDVSGNIRSSTGILFGTDTAAANLLDDYEEGTWTMGVAFNGASVGVTTSANTGTYTKIGRQVTVNGLIVLTSKGSSTGSATITGLPFTIANSSSNYSAVSLRFDTIAFTNQFQGFGAVNTTTINLEEITILGVVSSITDADFANSCSVMVSFTYFV